MTSLRKGRVSSPRSRNFVHKQEEELILVDTKSIILKDLLKNKNEGKKRKFSTFCYIPLSQLVRRGGD